MRLARPVSGKIVRRNVRHSLSIDVDDLPAVSNDFFLKVGNYALRTFRRRTSSADATILGAILACVVV